MIGPTTFAKAIRIALTRDIAKARADGADDAAVVDTLLRSVMCEYCDAIDPDRRCDECEECGRFDEDLLMEVPIDGKQVCYDCYRDLGGKTDEDNHTQRTS